MEFLLGCQAHPFSFSPFQVEFSVACLTPSDVLRRGFRGVLEDYFCVRLFYFRSYYRGKIGDEQSRFYLYYFKFVVLYLLWM